jgi:hypothetical protein
MYGDDTWKWAQRLLIVLAALAVVGCVSLARWAFGAA